MSWPFQAGGGHLWHTKPKGPGKGGWSSSNAVLRLYKMATNLSENSKQRQEI